VNEEAPGDWGKGCRAKNKRTIRRPSQVRLKILEDGDSTLLRNASNYRHIRRRNL